MASTARRYEACASELCEWTWTDDDGDDNAQVKAIERIVASHDLRLSNTYSERLLGRLASNNSLHQITDFLAKTATIVQRTPTELIFESAVELLGHCAFVDRGDGKTVGIRHVRVKRRIKTPLWTAVERHIATLSNDAVTLVVGGPSGGGKTFALVSQARPVSRGHPTEDSALDVIAAYLRPSKMIGDAALLRGPEQPTRDATVLEWLIGELAGGSTIPKQTFGHMAKLASDAPLRVLVIVDEMGDFRLATRALCRLKGADVRRALEEKVNCTLANVHFFIAVAGTGIGSVDDDAPTNTKDPFASIGSESGTFTFLSTFNGASREDAEALRANLDIFWSQLGPHVCPAKCEGHLHPLVRAFVSENARMAAVVGDEISKSIAGGAFGDKSLPSVFCAIDQSSYLTAATLRFKQLNGLQSVNFEELWGLLVKAVRMHFFPHALTRGARTFEVKYGLVASRRLRPTVSSEDETIGYSPVGLPSVSVMLLAQLLGVPALTKSIVSGMALEEYALSTLFLIACAACDSELFRRALDYQSGVLVPLKSDASLPPSSDDTLVSLIYDLSRDAIPERADVAVAGAARKGAARSARKGAAEVAHSRLVTDVARVLEALGPRKGPGHVYVAALRSYDKASSADIMLFVNDALFLFQCKDTASKIASTAKELGKMGASAENIPSRATLAGLVCAWHKATGVQVTIVHMCFLTPNKTVGGAISPLAAEQSIECVGASGEKWRAAIDDKVRCVSVCELRFLRFDADRARAPPYASGVLPKSLIVKSQTITPPLKDAPLTKKRGKTGGKRSRQVNYNCCEGAPRDRTGGRRVEEK